MSSFHAGNSEVSDPCGEAACYTSRHRGDKLLTDSLGVRGLVSSTKSLNEKRGRLPGLFVEHPGTFALRFYAMALSRVVFLEVPLPPHECSWVFLDLFAGIRM